jgi:hypothetical protein
MAYMLCERSNLFGDESGLIVTLAISGIAIVVVILRLLAAHRRRKTLAEFAIREGFEFIPDPGPLHEKYAAFEPFETGRGWKSTNLLHRRAGKTRWEMFDYKYSTGSGKNRRTHYRGIVAANVEIDFPQLAIRPEGLLDRLAGVVGFDDIDFESAEFSRRYFVKSSDRKAAYDIIHPRMMEFLLAQPDAHWQVLGTSVVLAHSRHYEPEEMLARMRSISQFLELVPEFVRQDLSSDG